MTDHFETDARIRDLIEGLSRTLNDPGLSQRTKIEETLRVSGRMETLDAQRPLAENLSVLADALTPVCPRCDEPGVTDGSGRLWCRNEGCSFVFPFGDAA